MKTEIIYGLIAIALIVLFGLISFYRNSYIGKTSNQRKQKEQERKIKKQMSWWRL